MDFYSFIHSPDLLWFCQLWSQALVITWLLELIRQWVVYELDKQLFMNWIVRKQVACFSWDVPKEPTGNIFILHKPMMIISLSHCRWITSPAPSRWEGRTDCGGTSPECRFTSGSANSTSSRKHSCFRLTGNSWSERGTKGEADISGSLNRSVV